jgi:hypothetical protein
MKTRRPRRVFPFQPPQQPWPDWTGGHGTVP